MRIRKKTWARPELSACSYFIAEPQAHRGNWMTCFGNKRPIYLDLGCGKCVFLAEAARQNREVNWIGIDISCDILGVGRRNIAAAYGDEEPDNIALCSYNIERLQDVFSAGEGIRRIYVNFCNPWTCARAHKRRLTHTRQLETYKTLLDPDGEIWFKTDNNDLYLATKRYFAEAGLEIFFDSQDLLAERDPENLTTEHEQMFSAQGIKIKALRARLKP